MLCTASTVRKDATLQLCMRGCNALVSVHLLSEYDGFVCTSQADQIRQALEEYASSDVWALETDAGGNPTILLGEHDTAG